MSQEFIGPISEKLHIAAWQVEAAARLLSEDATVPFIARYRKEATGSLDEVAVTAIRDELARMAALAERRDTVLRSLEKNGHLTDELKEKILAAQTMTALEDLYLPYRPKRRTRAAVAREKGLEPLAELLAAQDDKTDPEAEAARFVDGEKGVASVLEALAGARDIIAENVAENAEARAALRSLFQGAGSFKTSVVPGKEEEGAKFRDYFEWSEPVSTAPSHRVLAMRRGEREGMLDMTLSVPEPEALEILQKMFIKGVGPCSVEVGKAINDSYRRLIFRSLETEIRLSAKERADETAVSVFAQNLRHLLLAPPLGRKRVLAIDPGLRTGCKVVVLDSQGALLENELVQPHQSEEARRAAGKTLAALCAKHGVQAVAVGNGTAGRETEAFVRGLSLPGSPPLFMVDESGASIYSASDVAREEFPDQDVTVRGAVSIGRRLMDPLSELVKIDPKSIGVGQYQHDVDQDLLKKSLDDVVVSCVNGVGVELNTASEKLLQYVSGLSAGLARNIVAFRNQNGPFQSRRQLGLVPRLGPKAFEQAAGFLRIRDGENPLDASAVHPERYPVVEKMAEDLGATVSDLLKDAGLRKRIVVRRYLSEGLGESTLADIMAELEKPGRDPRESITVFAFAPGVNEIADVRPGMVLPGIVTNVTRFGAFVDVGVHVDGLIHISELSDRFVKDPSEVIRVQQQVMARVLSVDVPRNRIALSLKKEAAGSEALRTTAEKGPAQKQKPGKTAPASTAFNNPFAKLSGLGKK
ncbi:MAG: Tex family protein [Thermodesulfobacteriota bacterium]